MSAPGGILMAKIIMPDEDGDAAHDRVDVTVSETFEEGNQPANVIETAAQGEQTGVKLAVAVGARVLVFVALVALANGLWGRTDGWFGTGGRPFSTNVGWG